MFSAILVTVEKPILIQNQNLFNDFYENQVSNSNSNI